MKLFGLSITPRQAKTPRQKLFEGGCALLVLIWVVLVMFQPWTSPGKPRRMTCLSSMKLLTTDLNIYAQDYDDRLPLSLQWRVTLSPYTHSRTDIRCPEAAKEGKELYGIAFHSLLSGRHIFDESPGAKALPSDIIFPESMPMLFDTRLPGASVSASLLEGLASPGRHQQNDRVGNHVAFVDGHAKWISDTEVKTLRTTVR